MVGDGRCCKLFVFRGDRRSACGDIRQSGQLAYLFWFQFQIDNAVCNLAESVSSQPSTGDLIAAEVNCVNSSAMYSSPRKLVALPSETTVMVDGQKCVLRVAPSTGRLMACPVVSGNYMCMT